MGFHTRNVPGGSKANRLPLLAAVLGIEALAALAFFGVRALAGEPTPEEVVEAFRDAGAGVGASYPVEQDPDFMESPTPRTCEEGTRFEIPSLGKDAGGRVFSYESQEDLQVMRNYYEKLEETPLLGPALRSHLYQDGLLLVQINGDLPKTQADRYGEILEEEV